MLHHAGNRHGELRSRELSGRIIHYPMIILTILISVLSCRRAVLVVAIDPSSWLSLSIIYEFIFVQIVMLATEMESLSQKDSVNVCCAFLS